MRTNKTTIVRKKKDVVTSGVQRGVNHHQAKLTDVDVKIIRKQLTVRQLAEKFKVSTKLIYDIRRNNLWTHVVT